MRVLRLFDPDDFAVEFHPYVTVVRGLVDGQRDKLVEAFARIPSGRTGELAGLIEAHGVVLDLTPEMMELLALDSGDLEVVVRDSDLPNAPDAAAARVRDAQRRVAELESQIADVERTRGELRDRLARAEGVAPPPPAPTDDPSRPSASIDDVGADLADLETQARMASDRRQEAAARCTALAAQIEEANSSIDADASEALERARERLETVRAEVDAERAEDTEIESVAAERPEDRLARLEVRRAELDQLLAALAGTDREQVQHALEAVADASDAESELVASADALVLADRIEALERRIASLGTASGDADPGGDVAAAEQRLEVARAALMEAEQNVRLPQLEPADVDELEQAHAEVLDAQDKLDGRFAGARAERRLAEAREIENAVLDRMGFTTYADYMMGTSILHVDDASEAALDRARVELAAAEDAWADLQQTVNAELDRAELGAERQSLLAKATTLLGADVDAVHSVHELRAHRVPADAGADAVAHLRTSLVAAGIDVADETIDADDLVALAADWVREEEQAVARRDRTLDERNAVDADLAETRRELSQAAVGLNQPDAEQRRSARVDDAIAAVQAAEEHVRRHEEAVGEVERLRTELDAASQIEQEAATEAAAIDETMRARRTELDDLRAAPAEPETVDDADPDDEADAAVDLDAARAELADLDGEHARLEGDLASARRTATDQPAPAASGSPTPSESEEIEWYLLARLAAQRQVSYAGSVPLVIDEALDGLDELAVNSLLDRLERMAAAVQLVLLSDTPAVVDWATSAGDARVAIVEPIPASSLSPVP